jgi:diacylglycerol diphosphate phosphatase/phosphatidate phosphatase
MVTAKEFFVDYHFIDFIVLAVLAVVWFFMNRMTPRRLYVPKKDPRCSYPHYNTGITETQNLIIVLVTPLSVYLFLYILLKARVELKFIKKFDLFLVIIGHFGSVVVSNIFANIIKLQVGRPRPDFFTVLGPNATSESLCPEDLSKKEFDEEFKSFPSGHSASAMSGTLFLAIFLLKAIKSKQFWLKLLVLSLFVYPYIIGCTRITQYRHHPDDVIMGFFIGSAVPIVYFLTCSDDMFCAELFP